MGSGTNHARRSSLDDGGFNVLGLIPIEMQAPIESALFLSTGTPLGIFILIGFGITVDAYFVSTKQPLPGFLSAVLGFVKPNFTNFGLAFLASSVSLGGFKIAQLTNPGVMYTEDDS
eukprot:FR735981.1.p1 GENE.FR735981.1~~FR735981.1.p1  ORF type:complete len:124 (+),score=11.68 FR735981.1:22-372(+)